MFGRTKPLEIPSPTEALPGRPTPMPVPERHFVLGTPMTPPWPPGHEEAVFGMGCFWGAERIYWQLDGVHTTAVGYAGGHTPNPTYQEVCTGMTGHNEVVLVVHDPSVVSFDTLLSHFWENHDPTQGMGQGNDVGTQYRSGIYTSSPEQAEVAERSRRRYQEALSSSGYAEITTEVVDRPRFFYAEDYHQQYLAKNPGGYCNHGFCQVAYPPSDH